MLKNDTKNCKPMVYYCVGWRLCRQWSGSFTLREVADYWFLQTVRQNRSTAHIYTEVTCFLTLCGRNSSPPVHPEKISPLILKKLKQWWKFSATTYELHVVEGGVGVKLMTAGCLTALYIPKMLRQSGSPLCRSQGLAWGVSRNWWCLMTCPDLTPPRTLQGACLWASF